MKYLIVNGDDFGASPGVNRGIREAHERGVLTSTSLLVDTSWSEDAAHMARGLPDLGVGLHVDFPAGHEEREDCRAELWRQFQRFETLMGCRPTHLDSHRSAHRHPRLFPHFLALAQEYGIPLREHSPVRCLPSFYGQWDGETHLEQIERESLLRMLREVRDGVTELICHPGYVDAHLRSSYSIERETELRTLCDPAVRRFLEEQEIRLISFRDLCGLFPPR